MMLYSIALCLMMSTMAMGMNCPKACPRIYRPVCGTDNKDYNNICLLKHEACKSHKHICIKHEGKCSEHEFVCDFSKSLPLSPVCGSNGKTYNHECFLNAANCHYDAEITVLHKRPCTDADLPCPKLYLPVCGSNGETYDSMCMLKFAASNTKKAITPAHEGPCEKTRDDHCYFAGVPDEHPVCGTDGKDYFNPCLMQAQSCLSNVKITVANEGSCK